MRIARSLAAATAASAVALVVAAPGSADATRISGVVGPGYSITLTDAAGNKVTRLEPGQFELVVDDRSEFHNFHLTGPGVDVTTGVEDVGRRTFQITVTDGTYRYVCDPHLGDMNGSFTVGTASAAGSGGGASSGGGTPARAPKTSAPVGAKLSLTVGPGSTISLKTAAGKPVTALAAGSYTFVVNDRASVHNAHLTGAGVNRSTTVPFVGTTTLKLTLKKGRLTFVCDPHKSTMKGGVAVS